MQPLPNQRSARNSHGRVATGVFTISARDIHALHARRQPRTLAGDWRTTRAPAMCPPWRNPQGPYNHRVTRADPVVLPHDRGLDGNPNKGACRTKIIGLDHDFTQPIRIEQWRFPRRIRPAYYLVCPGTYIARNLARNNPHRDPRLPGLSTLPPGRKATGCPQRCLKLMLVQCTEAEYADALAALDWIDAVPSRYLPLCRPHIHRLLLRYGPIMPPRTLLCPRCLGVHYGNNPETIRQGWRRRNHKPPTTIPARLHQLIDPTPTHTT